MKTPTNNLHKLVHSMSAAEKRYFKRHYSSDNNLTTTLFDIINSMAEYDEEIVKKRFGDEKSAKNLKVYKIVLTDLLLKSLLSYHHKKDLKSKIKQGLEEVNILINKGLIVVAADRLKKIKLLCKKSNDIQLLPAVIQMEIKLSQVSTKTNELSQQLEEIQTVYQDLKTISQYKYTYTFLQNKRNHYLTEEITSEDQKNYTKLLNEELLPALEAKRMSFFETVYTYLTAANIYGIIQENVAKEYSLKNSCLQLFKEKPDNIQSHYHLYWDVLNSLAATYLQKEDQEGFALLLEDIAQLAKQYPLLNLRRSFIDFVKTKLYYKSGQFAKINGLIKELPELEVNTKDSNQHLNLVNIHLYAALAHISLNDYKKAHYLIKKLQWQTFDLDVSYKFFFDFFELISHYETNDIRTLNYLLNSHNRKIKKAGCSSVFFKESILFFNQLVNANQEDIKNLANAFKNSLLKMEADKILKIANNYILTEWLDSLGQEQPLAVILYKKNKDNSKGSFFNEILNERKNNIRLPNN